MTIAGDGFALGRVNNKAVYIWGDGIYNTINSLTGDNSVGVCPALWLNIGLMC